MNNNFKFLALCTGTFEYPSLHFLSSCRLNWYSSWMLTVDNFRCKSVLAKHLNHKTHACKITSYNTYGVIYSEKYLLGSLATDIIPDAADDIPDDNDDVIDEDIFSEAGAW